jgi:hypothetical protein
MQRRVADPSRFLVFAKRGKGRLSHSQLSNALRLRLRAALAEWKVHLFLRHE